MRKVTPYDLPGVKKLKIQHNKSLQRKARVVSLAELPKGSRARQSIAVLLFFILSDALRNTAVPPPP